MARRHSDSSISARGLGAVIAAALLETTCRPPKVSTVASTATATEALSFTSQPIASARPPDASIREATAPAPPASMSAHATQAPSAAKHSAIALPIPLADPAMNATLPSSFVIANPLMLRVLTRRAPNARSEGRRRTR
jgi:hypothetical protein